MASRIARRLNLPLDLFTVQSSDAITERAVNSLTLRHEAKKRNYHPRDDGIDSESPILRAIDELRKSETARFVVAAPVIAALIYNQFRERRKMSRL